MVGISKGQDHGLSRLLSVSVPWCLGGLTAEFRPMGVASMRQAGFGAAREHSLRGDVVRHKLAAKVSESSRGKMGAQIGHYFQIQVGVMHAEHAQPQDFPTLSRCRK